VKLRANSKLANCELRNLPVQSHNFHIVAIKHEQTTIIPTGSDIISPDDIVYFITPKEHVAEIRELCEKTQRPIKSIAIAGASRIGLRFSLQYHEKYDIKIIESDISKCEYAAELLPSCEVVCGDVRNVELLRDNNLFRYDAFMALTGSSETNILACLTAKEFNVAKTIAEVENIQFIPQAEKLNIGTIINKKLLASSRIFKILLDADTDNSKCLTLADAEVAEIQVKKGANITKRVVRDLHLPYGMTLGAYIRDGRCHLIDGSTQIEVGDYVVVFCLTGLLHKIEKWFN
jgi:trk system potassium uptake protein TrkA